MSTNRMLPGQEPYTAEEKVVLNRMLRDACEAEELFDLDELEEYARQYDEDEENRE